MSTPDGGLFGFALRPVGVIILFFVGAITVFSFGERVLEGILNPLCPNLLAAGQDCILVYASPRSSFDLVLKASLLGGIVMAVPCLLYQSTRLFAPTLFHKAPQATSVYAWAGGVVAVLGVVFVVYYEAPRAVSGAVAQLASLPSNMPMLGYGAVYVRAVLDMAGTYVMLLQIPLILAMMVKSARLKRVLHSEVQS